MADDLIQTYERGVAAVRDGRLDQAAIFLGSIAASKEIDPGRREHARMLLGYAKGKLDDWSGAIECFREVLRNDPECIPAETALGHAMVVTGRIPEAIEIFRSALRKDPENPQSIHGLAWALLEEGKDLKEALYQAQEALRRDPESAPIRDTVGWIFFRTGELEAAEEQLEKAILIDPDHAVILEHRHAVREALARKKAEKR
jgi:tetratricopeptide (TPR) repeat protein